MAAKRASSRLASAPFARYWQARRALLERELERMLPPAGTSPQVLHRAMRYSVFAGGKRLRPVLALAACELCGKPPGRARRAAAAIELIHTYSLIHDDLPAMDDDDWRRGRPTCHRAFDQATAILAGDALLTLAFRELSRASSDPRAAARVVREVAEAIGSQGMVAGQVYDLAAEGRRLAPREVERLERLKTARLITVSLRVGALLAGASARDLRLLSAYGEDLGLAFQIADDLLDLSSTRREMGKDTKKDAARSKATYPAVVGLSAARAAAERLADRAARRLSPFGARARFLQELARFAVERRN